MVGNSVSGSSCDSFIFIFIYDVLKDERVFLQVLHYIFFFCNLMCKLISKYVFPNSSTVVIVY